MTLPRCQRGLAERGAARGFSFLSLLLLHVVSPCLIAFFHQKEYCPASATLPVRVSPSSVALAEIQISAGQVTSNKLMRYADYNEKKRAFIRCKPLLKRHEFAGARLNTGQCSSLSYERMSQRQSSGYCQGRCRRWVHLRRAPSSFLR